MFGSFPSIRNPPAGSAHMLGMERTEMRRKLYYFHHWVYSRIYFFLNMLYLFSFKHLLNAFLIGNLLRVDVETSAMLISLLVVTENGQSDNDT